MNDLNQRIDITSKQSKTKIGGYFMVYHLPQCYCQVTLDISGSANEKYSVELERNVSTIALHVNRGSILVNLP